MEVKPSSGNKLQLRKRQSNMEKGAVQVTVYPGQHKEQPKEQPK